MTKQTYRFSLAALVVLGTPDVLWAQPSGAGMSGMAAAVVSFLVFTIALSTGIGVAIAALVVRLTGRRRYWLLAPISTIALPYIAFKLMEWNGMF